MVFSMFSSISLEFPSCISDGSWKSWKVDSVAAVDAVFHAVVPVPAEGMATNLCPQAYLLMVPGETDAKTIWAQVAVVSCEIRIHTR